MIAGEARCLPPLAWLNPAEVRRLLGRDRRLPADGDLVTEDRTLLRLLADRCAVYSTPGHGSAARVERLLVLARPASAGCRQITDEGPASWRRRVLAERAALVDLLYPGPPRPA